MGAKAVSANDPQCHIEVWSHYYASGNSINNSKSLYADGLATHRQTHRTKENEARYTATGATRR